MRTPFILLKFVGKAFLQVSGGGLLSEFATDVLPALADDVMAWWKEDTSEDERRAELEALAQTPQAEIQQAIQQVVREVAADRPPDVQQNVELYLQQLPGSVRRSLRRPEDPTGKTIPAGMRLDKPQDLLALLPDRLPRFKPGARPFGDSVDRELVELLGVGGFGEVWKARNPNMASAPPVALKFCLDPAAARSLRNEAALLERIARQELHSGIVPLLNTYLSAQPPCLEYEYIEGGDLAGFLQEQGKKGGPTPELAARVVLSLANAVASAHQQTPPIVHRDLKPANVLVRRLGEGKYHFKVADFGIGGIATQQAIAAETKGGDLTTNAGRGSYTLLYASPQQMQGQAADPRDDVHALGVIWHQLLTRNLTAGAPSGLQWMKALEKRGLSQDMIQLLASCIEARAEDRPASAAVLAQRLSALLPAKSGARAPISAVNPASSTTPSRESPERLMTVPQAAAQSEEPKHVAGSRPRRRSPVVLILMGLLVLAAGGVVAFRVRPDLFGLESPADGLQTKGPADGDKKTVDNKKDLVTKVPSQRNLLEKNSIGMEFRLLPARKFIMGSPKTEERRNEGDEDQHEVFISKPFYMGVHEVTQEQYQRVMKKNPSANKKKGMTDNHPVEQVSWDDAVNFCEKLGELPDEKMAGRSYRLPTEAEWEYACRGDTDKYSPYSYGDKFDKTMANVSETRYPDRQTVPVGSYKPNSFYLFDMHGNVREWCSDFYEFGYYQRSPPQDPKGPDDKTHRVVRGGDYLRYGYAGRSAARATSNKADETTGFRVVMELPYKE